MKVLLWGIYSPWTMNFVENFLLKNNYEVWMLNRGKKKEYGKYIEFFKQKGIHLIDVPEIVSEVYDKKESENNWYSHFLLLKAVAKSGPYDLINMQFVEYFDLIDVVILKYMMRSRLVLSYWGSDLLRVGESKLSHMSLFARCADFVTFDNNDLEIEFKKAYKWAENMPGKVAFFGLPVLDVINEKDRKEETEDIRRKWGIPEDKKVIAIGYNGIPEQQHKKVLGAIEQLEDSYKEKIVLLLQMSYGGTRGYRNSVVAMAKKSGCEYLDIQHFLSNDEVAELRIMTDIYINAQVTDAFSGSVCENLFAGTVLINARWLRYKEFETYNFKYLEFESISQIGSLIKKAFNEKIDVTENKQLIWKLRSWERCGPTWKRIYRKMYKNNRKRKIECAKQR